MKSLPSLMVAPNGARKTKADHPEIPITIEETVMTAERCFKAGATGLHLHLRDDAGKHLLDAKLYQLAIRKVKLAVPELSIQITTEAVGIYTPAEQRAIVDQVKPELVSISLAEMLSEGHTKDVEDFYHRCAGNSVAVQHIIYGPEDLLLLEELIGKGTLDHSHIQLIYVLGRYTEGQQSEPEDLAPFIHWLQSSSIAPDWSVCAFGLKETDCLVAANKAGGKMRVGFENSFWNLDGSVAANNEERVAEVVAAVANL